jgi:hypothetical protein
MVFLTWIELGQYRAQNNYCLLTSVRVKDLLQNEVYKMSRLFCAKTNCNLLRNLQTYVFRNGHSMVRLGNRITHLLTILTHFDGNFCLQRKITTCLFPIEPFRKHYFDLPFRNQQHRKL